MHIFCDEISCSCIFIHLVSLKNKSFVVDYILVFIFNANG